MSTIFRRGSLLRIGSDGVVTQGGFFNNFLKKSFVFVISFIRSKVKYSDRIGTMGLTICVIFFLCL